MTKKSCDTAPLSEPDKDHLLSPHHLHFGPEVAVAALECGSEDPDPNLALCSVFFYKVVSPGLL